MWRKIKFYTVSTVILVLAGAAVYFYYFGGRARGGTRRVADPPALVKQIQALDELVTVKYTVQKVIGLKEEKVPFGSESVMLMVQAKVLGGVDLAGLRTNDVTIAADRAVTIKLPPPRVLHVYVDDRETQVWERSKTWWTPWVPNNPELEQKARLAALEAVQAAALEMGILQEAQRNAHAAISNLLVTAGVPAVRLETVNAPRRP